MNYIKIACIFGFDLTLVQSDYDKEKETLFLTLDFIKKIEKAIKFFHNKVSLFTNNVFILTTRHKTLQYEIARFLSVYAKNVYCTNDLEIEELKKVNSSKKNTKIFLEKSLNDKISILNLLSKKYDKIYFYDDMIEDFEKRKHLINRKVYLKNPYKEFLKND